MMNHRNKIKLETCTETFFKDIFSIQNYPLGFNKFLLYNEGHKNSQTKSGRKYQQVCKYKKILWLSEPFDYKSAWYIYIGC
jgi:hypothetical protein